MIGFKAMEGLRQRLADAPARENGEGGVHLDVLGLERERETGDGLPRVDDDGAPLALIAALVLVIQTGMERA